MGGGPAGLAAAIAARQIGLTVTVVDAANPPIDKACGEGLMPDGVEALKRLGVRLGSQHAVPFSGIRFINGDTSARADFPGVYGLGVRRTTLHALLVERAAEIGVTLLWNTNACAEGQDVILRPVAGFAPALYIRPHSARWTIGADGANSHVRRRAGFGNCPPSVRRFGFRRHFPVAPWSDTVDVYWGHDCQVYVTPVAEKEVCVAVISRHQALRLEESLRAFPELDERLRGLVPLTPERGSISECRRLKKVYRGNVALIGDASGSVDAITGEGLSLSFKQALALAEALAANDLSSYNAAHRHMTRIPAVMAQLMLLMDERAGLRRRVIRILAARPMLFSKLLAIHIDARPPLEVNLPCFQFSRTR